MADNSKLPIEYFLEKDAKCGYFYSYKKITKTKAAMLEEQGFNVTDTCEYKYYPRFHKISWKHAKIKCKDINLLNPNDESYNLPQKLWIIASQNQP